MSVTLHKKWICPYLLVWEIRCKYMFIPAGVANVTFTNYIFFKETNHFILMDAFLAIIYVFTFKLYAVLKGCYAISE